MAVVEANTSRGSRAARPGVLPVLCLLALLDGCSGASGAEGAGAADGGDGSAGRPGDAGARPDGGTSPAPGEDGGAQGPATAAVGEPCGSAATCEAGAVCAAGVCADDLGGCEDDADCGGDSYCCAAGCLTAADAGRCVPYGQGPRGDVSDVCLGERTIGLFEPSVQCEWTAPPEGDPFPQHVQVLATPLVADLPNDSGDAAEIVIVTYNGSDGGPPAGAGTKPAFFGVIRILSGQTCQQLETVHDPDHPIIGASTPAIADLDGDGDVEIVTYRAGGRLIAFKWSEAERRYVRYWVSSDTSRANQHHWDGPALHDLNDDGLPEVIANGQVFRGTDGERLNPGQVFARFNGTLSIVADVDGDGAVELVGQRVHRWNVQASRWEEAYTGPRAGVHFAFADFGTQGATPEDFDPSTLDGIAEVVATGGGQARLTTLDGQILLNVPSGLSGGGPPTIGDFDNDGFPEFASAGGTHYRVFDLDCAEVDGKLPDGCEARWVRWSRPSQDASSATTGSSIFDFEGDGKAEAVYADECFTRIYEGDTGRVLYSAYRTSCTWYENAVIADPDRDQNTEILVGNNANCSIKCPFLDEIHPGTVCDSDDMCLSGRCVSGLCRCSDDSECGENLACAPPIDGSEQDGQVCRATHPAQAAATGLVVLRDRLDRWASSRPMWNQHAYSVTNILDDGRVPHTSNWTPNFTQPALNHFRQNVQGATASEDLPDITGSLDQANVCSVIDGTTTLTATVCNRGKRAVGAALPATFYLGDPSEGRVLCVSYTEGPVSVGSCRNVSCDLADDVSGEITMVVNDDGDGGRTTVECVEDNNADQVEVTDCTII